MRHPVSSRATWLLTPAAIARTSGARNTLKEIFLVCTLSPAIPKLRRHHSGQVRMNLCKKQTRKERNEIVQKLLSCRPSCYCKLD